MKRKLLILILLFPLFVSAQGVTLEQCWHHARNNMPVLQGLSSLAKLDSLEQMILKTNYYPQLNARAQVTWQSDVTGIDLDLPPTFPEINIDQPDKDQYKVYAEINQLIWDGGRTKALRKKNETETLAGRAETEMAFYEVKKRVAGLYYALMLSQKQIDLSNELVETLDKKLSEVKIAVDQGVAMETGMYLIEAEKVQAAQDLTGQIHQAKAVAQMLHVLTGMDITYTDSLAEPVIQIPETVNRQQLEVFQLQQESLHASGELLQKNRMPVVSAFVQGGYGKPGLNMLKNEAGSWILSGATVSWNIFDWNVTKRKQQQMVVRSRMIDHNREQFLQQVKTEKQQYLADIDRYRQTLSDDEQLVELRSRITKGYGSQLKQGTTTPSVYVEQLFKEQSARIMKEIHSIRLKQAQTSLQILLEK